MSTENTNANEYCGSYRPSWRMEVDEVALEGEGILGLIRTGGRLNRALRRDELRDRSTLASWVVPT